MSLQINLFNPAFEPQHQLFGANSLAAALGVLALAEADAVMAARAALVDRYRARLDGVAGVRLQQQPAGTVATPTYFAVALNGSRDAVAAALAAEGIEARPYFPALHAMERLRALPAAPLPVTERLSASLLALPLHTALGADDVDEETRRQQHVLLAAQLLDQVERLKDEADMPEPGSRQRPWGLRGQLVAGQHDPAGVGDVEPAEQM